MIYEHVMVPVDGSKGSQQAIELVKKMAQEHPAIHIILVHAVDVGIVATANEFYAYDPALGEVLQNQGKTILDKAKEQLSGRNVSTHLLQGHPGDAIVEMCHTEPVDLVVMSLRGNSPVTRLFVGSVTEYVLHHAPVPVLSIPIEK